MAVYLKYQQPFSRIPPRLKTNGKTNIVGLPTQNLFVVKSVCTPGSSFPLCSLMHVPFLYNQLLNRMEEFEEAVKKTVTEVRLDNDVVVSVFETNIRVLGYDLLLIRIP